MNIKHLEQFSDLKNEVKILQERIKMYEKKADETVNDSVKGSMTCSPFIERTIIISGVNDKAYTNSQRIKFRLVEKRKRIEELLEQIEMFVHTVDKSDIRQLIQLKYIDGYSWKATASKVYGYPCEDRARKRITRFFAEI